MRNNKINFIVKVGAFSAIAFILQVIGSMMSIKVAGFLEVEISDLPAIIISLALGPWAGVMVEFIKNLLHCAMTSTGFVGEFANFVINGSFMLVCGLVYKSRKTKKNAVISLVLATLVMTVVGFFANIFVMLPLYMPSADFAAKVNLAAFTIVPFNFCKGIILSAVTMLVYKKISGLIK